VRWGGGLAEQFYVEMTRIKQFYVEKTRINNIVTDKEVIQQQWENGANGKRTAYVPRFK
jgi:hypothetical protein